jgi:hypothetical protein
MALKDMDFAPHRPACMASTSSASASASAPVPLRLHATAARPAPRPPAGATLLVMRDARCKAVAARSSQQLGFSAGTVTGHLHTAHLT